jgi:hypothetical protein
MMKGMQLDLYVTVTDDRDNKAKENVLLQREGKKER